MKIQTLSVIAGTTACNACCPYCISKMTPKQGVEFKEPEVNWRNFSKACRLAQISQVTTVLITGKGEPTLFPEQLTKFLENMREFSFPLIELQTNGLLLCTQEYDQYLKKWYSLGLTMIAVSVLHYAQEKNKDLLQANTAHFDLEKLIEKLHKFGFSVRLNCILTKDYTDNVEEVFELIKKTKEWKVEQLSLRKLGLPFKSQDKKIENWVKNHSLSDLQIEKINDALEKQGSKIMTLENGGVVYDVNGQNVCLTDCLTLSPESENLRQIIFFPDGRLRFDWQFEGAVLI